MSTWEPDGTPPTTQAPATWDTYDADDPAIAPENGPDDPQPLPELVRHPDPPVYSDDKFMGDWLTAAAIALPSFVVAMVLEFFAIRSFEAGRLALGIALTFPAVVFGLTMLAARRSAPASDAGGTSAVVEPARSASLVGAAP